MLLVSLFELLYLLHLPRRHSLAALADKWLFRRPPDCGSLSCSNEWIKAKIAENDPEMKDGPFLSGAHMWAQSLAFLPFDWKEGESERQVLERSVVEDVQFLRNHPLIKPIIPITGWIFNQETGEVEEVDCGLENGLSLGLIQKLKEQIGTKVHGEITLRTAH